MVLWVGVRDVALKKWSDFDIRTVDLAVGHGREM